MFTMSKSAILLKFTANLLLAMMNIVQEMSKKHMIKMFVDNSQVRIISDTCTLLRTNRCLFAWRPDMTLFGTCNYSAWLAMAVYDSKPEITDQSRCEARYDAFRKLRYMVQDFAFRH